MDFLKTRNLYKRREILNRSYFLFDIEDLKTHADNIRAYNNRTHGTPL